MHEINTNGFTARSIHNLSPIAMGGIGGSGTRVVAELVNRMGIFIGDSINRSNDNLSFVQCRLLLEESDDQIRDRQISTALHQFEAHMHAEFQLQQQPFNNWGWKVPGQFHLLSYTAQYFPRLKYIHVIRHGLDMAFSKNKNQLHNWGELHGVKAASRDDPVAALEYWIKANQFAIQQSESLLGERFLLLNFDQLCHSPSTVIQKLAEFVGDYPVDGKNLQSLVAQVVKPSSMGRYKAYDYDRLFGRESVNAVQAMGFSV